MTSNYGDLTYGAGVYGDGTGVPIPDLDWPRLKIFIDLSGSPSASPVWQALADTRVLSFSSSRGRNSELSEFEAGTATLTVGNRDRAFDPTFVSSPYYPYIRPMTRFWLRAELGGTLYDVFKGYAEHYDGTWPDGGWSNAECTISLVDEFKVLALDSLPTTSPPRNSYEELIGSDNPAGYWRMNEPVETNVQPPADTTVNWVFQGGYVPLLTFGGKHAITGTGRQRPR